MPSLRQTIIHEFVNRPPRLDGGFELRVEPLGEAEAVVVVADGPERFRGRAALLTVPFPSGLRRLRASHPDVDVVLLERATPALDRAAQEQGVGYVDLAGRGRLVGPGFVYVVPAQESASRRRDAHDDGRPVVASGRARSSPFAPKASRVVRALLADPARRWRLSELADACRMNPGNVHRVLRALVDEGFVLRDRDLHAVEDPGSLLEAWADNARRQPVPERLSLPVRGDLRAAVERMLPAGGGAVVSGELAAELYAPHLASANALVHWLDHAAWDPEALREAAGARPLRADAQVVVDLVDPGVADFARERDGLPLVAPHQLYVDLFGARGRAREAAEHVRRELLRY